jgi:hypothetical protein
MPEEHKQLVSRRLANPSDAEKFSREAAAAVLKIFDE